MTKCRWIAWAEEADRGIIVVQQILDSSSEKTGKRKVKTNHKN